MGRGYGRRYHSGTAADAETVTAADREAALGDHTGQGLRQQHFDVAAKFRDLPCRNKANRGWNLRGLGRTSLGLTSTPFDLVIVDEAARCTASELAVPIQAGRWLVFVGDHVQLLPQHDEQVVKKVTPKPEFRKAKFRKATSRDYFSRRTAVGRGRP